MTKSGSIQCSHCGESFAWTVVGDVWAGGKDKEDIDCPACHYTAGTVMTSGTVHVERS
jgi:uncharacterized Zn-finger protein